MTNYSDWSIQQLREEFWRHEARIRRSREQPKDDSKANSEYGNARRELTDVAAELGKKYDDEVLYMDDRVWHSYL